MMSNYANVGNDVFAGNQSACDVIHRGEEPQAFDRTLHIWRDDYLTCLYTRPGYEQFKDALDPDTNMFLHYKEGHKIESMDPPLLEVMHFMKKPGRLLIHCASGHCRANVLAVVAKTVRGCEFTLAMAEVVAEQKKQRNMLPALIPDVMEQLQKELGSGN